MVGGVWGAAGGHRPFCRPPRLRLSTGCRFGSRAQPGGGLSRWLVGRPNVLPPPPTVERVLIPSGCGFSKGWRRGGRCSRGWHQTHTPFVCGTSRRPLAHSAPPARSPAPRGCCFGRAWGSGDVNRGRVEGPHFFDKLDLEEPAEALCADVVALMTREWVGNTGASVGVRVGTSVRSRLDSADGNLSATCAAGPLPNARTRAPHERRSMQGFHSRPLTIAHWPTAWPQDRPQLCLLPCEPRCRRQRLPRVSAAIRISPLPSAPQRLMCASAAAKAAAGAADKPPPPPSVCRGGDASA